MTLPSGPTIATAMRQLFFRASASAAAAAALACSVSIGSPYSGAGGDVGAGDACSARTGVAVKTAAPIVNAINMRIGILSLQAPNRPHRNAAAHAMRPETYPLPAQRADILPRFRQVQRISG